MKFAGVIAAGVLVPSLACGLRGQTAKAGLSILRVPEAVMAARVVSKIEPDRSMAPRNAAGTVVLSEVVDQDGFIEHISVLSGPEPARAAAVFAARQWSYKPYLVDGHAVAVETTATLTFPSGASAQAHAEAHAPTPGPAAKPYAPAVLASAPAAHAVAAAQPNARLIPVGTAPGPQLRAAAAPPGPLPVTERPAHRPSGGPRASLDALTVLSPDESALSSRPRAQWRILKRVGPVYPAAAEASGIEGIVVVQGVVKRDGTLHELTAVSGPQPLRQAAVDAAAQWEFALNRSGDPEDTPIREPIEFLLKGPARLPADVMAGRIERSVQPEYPAAAQAAGVTGSVTLHVLVGRQGQVEQAKAVSGPALLRDSALAAVKQWTWKPYLRNGVDQEVETDVVVAFSMQWAGVQ